MIQSHILTAFFFKLLFCLCYCFICAEDEDTLFYDYTAEESPYQCFRHSIDTGKESSASCYGKNVTWILRSNATGSYDLEFPILNCLYHKFYIEILVNEGVSEKQCENKSEKFTKLHSRRDYRIGNCTSNSSEQCMPKCSNGVVRFNFLYTSCYQVHIVSTEINSRSPPYINKYVYTNYTKQFLAGTPPPYNAKYSSKQEQLSLTVINDKYIWLETTQLIVSFNEISWGLILHPNQSIRTYGPNKGSRVVNCRVGNQKDFDGKVVCTITNVTEGDYNICTTIIGTDRCVKPSGHTSVWLPEPYICYWKDDNLTCRGESSEKVESSPPSISGDTYNSLIVIVVISLLLLAGIVYGTFKLIRIRSAESGAHAMSGSQVALQRNQKVLLLYARDCPQFMKLMESFRHLLKSYSCFEVFDCYNNTSHHWDELSRNPTIWMQQLLEQNDVKIVVVSSECAYLRQQAMIANLITRYYDPEANDNLFICALHYLNESLTQSDYKRVFVIRFDGFSDDRMLYTHINEYTRFALPKHYYELINYLNGAVVLKDETELNNLSALNILREDLDNLINYVDLNQEYLESLLYQTDVSV